jgi:hypothetical protein
MRFTIITAILIQCYLAIPPHGFDSFAVPEVELQPNDSGYYVFESRGGYTYRAPKTIINQLENGFLKTAINTNSDLRTLTDTGNYNLGPDSPANKPIFQYLNGKRMVYPKTLAGFEELSEKLDYYGIIAPEDFVMQKMVLEKTVEFDQSNTKIAKKRAKTAEKAEKGAEMEQREKAIDAAFTEMALMLLTKLRRRLPSEKYKTHTRFCGLGSKTCIMLETTLLQSEVPRIIKDTRTYHTSRIDKYTSVWYESFTREFEKKLMEALIKSQGGTKCSPKLSSYWVDGGLSDMYTNYRVTCELPKPRVS